MINGRIGFCEGPFLANVDLLENDGAIGLATPETSKPIINHIGIVTEPGVEVLINNIKLKVGRGGILELDNEVLIKSVIFPNGAPAATQITFVY